MLLRINFLQSKFKKYLKLITEKNAKLQIFVKNVLLPFLHRKLTNVAITGDKININVLPNTTGNGMLTYGERINIFTIYFPVWKGIRKKIYIFF